MGKGATTRKEALDTAERRKFVLNLRQSGATYPQIAEQALRHFGKDKLPRGWDERYAYKDVKRELDKMRDEMAEATEQIRELELMRLDRMMLALWSQAINGHQGAVDRILRIMKRRADLTGLDAPKKIDHSVDLSNLTDEELDAIIEGKME